MVIGLSSISAWLCLKSNSIWPAVIWHGGHNLFIQQIFLMLTVDTGIIYCFVDDFGIGILATSVILGIIFWTKRSGLWRTPAVVRIFEQKGLLQHTTAEAVA